jgi:hypothetical protein
MMVGQPAQHQDGLQGPWRGGGQAWFDAALMLLAPPAITDAAMLAPRSDLTTLQLPSNAASRRPTMMRLVVRVFHRYGAPIDAQRLPDVACS